MTDEPVYANQQEEKFMTGIQDQETEMFVTKQQDTDHRFFEVLFGRVDRKNKENKYFEIF